MNGNELPAEKKPEEEIELPEEKKRRRWPLAIPIILVVLLIALYIWIAPEWKERSMSLEVANRIGIDVSYTTLTFGAVPPSGNSERTVIITNMNDYDKIAFFNIEGNIRDFVATPATVIIKAGENATLPVTAEVPVSAEPGNYTGKFKIFLRRAIKGWDT